MVFCKQNCIIHTNAVAREHVPSPKLFNEKLGLDCNVLKTI